MENASGSAAGNSRKVSIMMGPAFSLALLGFITAAIETGCLNARICP
jgi:hypothetical protein